MITPDISERGIRAIKLKKQERIEEYNKNPKRCLYCGKIIDYSHRNKKFCNSSCAASYNNSLRTLSEETKQQISKTLRVHYKQEMEGKDSKYNYDVHKYKLVCKICGKTFYSCRKTAKHCSPKCTMSDPEVIDKIRNRQLQHVKDGTHKGWISRNISSYPEKFWMRVLDNNNIEYKREFYVGGYFLDFVIEINGKIVDLEIDGRQHIDRKEHDAKRDTYLESLGYIVYRIDWNSINKDEGKDIMNEKIKDFLNFLNSL